MGDGNCWPPTESTPLKRSPKKLSQVITSATPTAVPNLVHIRPWGLLGEWVKYNLNYLYLCPFFRELTYRSDELTDFRAWWLKWRGLVYGCAFLGFVDTAPHLGGKIPQKNPILERELVFSSQTREIKKHAYYQNYCIDSSHILHSDKDHQMPFVCGLNTHITNPRLRTATILKNRHISAAVWLILTKFGTATQFGLLSHPTIKNLKIQDGGGRHLPKSKCRHISATVGAIASKFGTLTQVDTPDHSISKIGPQ